jgi:hypothetical protein
LEQANWLIGDQKGATNRIGLPRTTLIYKMRKLVIETGRSLGARPVRQVADEQCHAAASPGVLLDTSYYRAVIMIGAKSVFRAAGERA